MRKKVKLLIVNIVVIFSIVLSPLQIYATGTLPPGPTNPPITIDMGNIQNAPPPWDTVNCGTWRLNSSTGQLERLDSANLGTWKLSNGELERFNSKAFKSGEQKASNSSYRYAVNQNTLAMSPEFTFIMFLDYVKQFVDIAWGKDADFIEFIQPYYDCSEYSDAWKNLDANIYFAYVDYGLMKVGAYVDEAGAVLSKFYVKYSNKMDVAFTKIKEVLSRNLLDYIFVDDVERIDLPPLEITVPIIYHPLEQVVYPPYNFDTGRRLNLDEIPDVINDYLTVIACDNRLSNKVFKANYEIQGICINVENYDADAKIFILKQYSNNANYVYAYYLYVISPLFSPPSKDQLFGLTKSGIAVDYNTFIEYIRTFVQPSTDYGTLTFGTNKSYDSSGNVGDYFWQRIDVSRFFNSYEAKTQDITTQKWEVLFLNNPYPIIEINAFPDKYNFYNIDFFDSLYDNDGKTGASAYRIAENGITNPQPIVDTTFDADALDDYNKAVQQAQQPSSDPRVYPDLMPETTPSPKPIEVPQPQPTETPKGSETGTGTETGTEPDTDTDPDSDLGNPDLAPYMFDLSKKFPFCVPFDLIRAFKLFTAEAKAPYFEIPFVFEPLGINYTFVIDFVQFEDFAKITRTFSTIAFIIFLIMTTRGLLRG